MLCAIIVAASLFDENHGGPRVSGGGDGTVVVL